MKHMRYLGIDYGMRFVGLALGDDETRSASPYTTSDQTDEDFFAILKRVVEREDVDAIVVGMPEREQGTLTQHFIDRLRNAVVLPVYSWTERFTSQEARRHIKAGSTADEHSIAAMLILQSYLDDLSSP